MSNDRYADKFAKDVRHGGELARWDEDERANDKRLKEATMIPSTYLNAMKALAGKPAHKIRDGVLMIRGYNRDSVSVMVEDARTSDPSYMTVIAIMFPGGTVLRGGWWPKLVVLLNEILKPHNMILRNDSDGLYIQDNSTGRRIDYEDGMILTYDKAGRYHAALDMED